MFLSGNRTIKRSNVISVFPQLQVETNLKPLWRLIIATTYHEMMHRLFHHLYLLHLYNDLISWAQASLLVVWMWTLDMDFFHVLWSCPKIKSFWTPLVLYHCTPRELYAPTPEWALCGLIDIPGVQILGGRKKLFTIISFMTVKIILLK